MSSFRQTLTVKRKSAVDTYVKGVLIPGAETTVNITASIQPLSANEMQLLPEGRRERESFNLYTDTKLFPGEDSTGKNADKVTISGADFEVFSCASWQNDVINHYKAVVIKL